MMTTSLAFKKIFVIEDSHDFRTLLAKIFKTEGYAVEVAANGQEALDKLREMTELPHLILLDLMMPIMDGFEFRVRQEQDIRLTNIPVVLMSAHGDIHANSERLRIKEAIRKPVPLEKLLEVVERAILPVG
jgi:CheY-like chemotaxis protein